MFPLVGIAATIRQGMSAYQEVFSRQSAFEYVERYVNGLLLSANKTLQRIYSQLVWPDKSERVKRRAMHAGVFESAWDREQLMARHRAAVASAYRPKERQVVSLDWTHGGPLAVCSRALGRAGVGGDDASLNRLDLPNLFFYR